MSNKTKLISLSVCLTFQALQLVDCAGALIHKTLMLTPQQTYFVVRLKHLIEESAKSLSVMAVNDRASSKETNVPEKVDESRNSKEKNVEETESNSNDISESTDHLIRMIRQLLILLKKQVVL